MTVHRAACEETATIRARTSSAATARAALVATAIGAELSGDVANHAWGVMDVLAVTDFPDIRLKCAIQSPHEGNILHHPARGRLPRPAVRRPRTRSTRQGRAAAARSPRKTLAQVANDACTPTPSRSETSPGSRCTRSASVVTDTFDDVPAAGGGHPPAAGVHRRRRLPHAQRQGRPGHERLDAGHVQPRLEARRRLAGPGQARAPAHLLRRAAGGRPAADRLRQRVVRDDQRRLRATRAREAEVPALLRRKAASRRASRPNTPPR